MENLGVVVPSRNNRSGCRRAPPFRPLGTLSAPNLPAMRVREKVVTNFGHACVRCQAASGGAKSRTAATGDRDVAHAGKRMLAVGAAKPRPWWRRQECSPCGLTCL
ncbi:hypothetical protein SESBI_42472 [Sesbania bispinosa]|nr:hypothetical protein SESBI_42472 [Sesbania bispinosa]